VAIITSLINWKGGVGKTTLTYHLATGLTYRRNRVLLIDLDPQCNLSLLAVGTDPYFNMVYEEGVPTLKTIFDSYFAKQPIRARDVILTKRVGSSPGNVFTHVDIVLGHQDLTLLDLKLAQHGLAYEDDSLERMQVEIKKISIIKELVEQVADDYDYVFIDCPPNVYLTTQNAFYASDYYIIPAIPDRLSTVGIVLICNQMEEFNREYRKKHETLDLPHPYQETKLSGIVFNKVEERRGAPRSGQREFIENVRSQVGGAVYASYLSDGDGISVAAQSGYPVFAHETLFRAKNTAQKQARCVQEIITEFLTRASVREGVMQ